MTIECLICNESAKLFPCDAGTTEQLLAAQECLQAQAAELEQADAQFAALCTAKEALQSQLDAQAEDLLQAQSAAAATVAEHEQLQHQHNVTQAHCQQLEHEMASLGQTLSQKQSQLQTKTDALDALQIQHAGKPTEFMLQACLVSRLCDQVLYLVFVRCHYARVRLCGDEHARANFQHP